MNTDSHRFLPGAPSGVTPPTPDSCTCGKDWCDEGQAPSVPVADLLRLADRIERDHAADFCACCSTDAQYLRDLAARYSKTTPARTPSPPVTDGPNG